MKNPFRETGSAAFCQFDFDLDKLCILNCFLRCCCAAETGGHQYKHGNGVVNGHAHHHTGNGSSATSHHNGTFDHAMCLTHKLKRRVSAKSVDVVDNVLQNPALSSVAGVAGKNIVVAKHLASVVYAEFATVTGKVVDHWYSTTLFLLPKQVPARFAAAVSGLVDKLLTFRYGNAANEAVSS